VSVLRTLIGFCLNLTTNGVNVNASWIIKAEIYG